MNELINYFGSQKALADFLGVKHGHIYYWLRNGLPIKRAIEIEKKTNGRFTRKFLCPHFFD
jgi:DNA-binding transcriptional regulator YdaS (Cro superfamily)